MKRFMQWIGILAAITALLAVSTFQVGEGEVAIVMRFGEVRPEPAGPGLHFKLPTPIDTVMRVDTRTHILDPKSEEYLTKDKKNIVVDAFMAWRVSNVQQYALTFRSSLEAETRLNDVLRSVLNDVLPSQEFAALISTKEGGPSLKDVNDDLTKRTHDRAIDRFGIDVKLAAIKRINFPGQNKNSVYSRMEADRKSLARGFRSEGEEQYTKIQSQTDREAAELRSDAMRKAATIKAETDAEVKRTYAEAAAKDPELWNLLQQLDLGAAAFGDKTTIVLPSDSPLLLPFEAPKASKPGKTGD